MLRNISRNSSTSSIEGFFGTPTRTPRLTRKERLPVGPGGEEPSTSGTSAPGTPVAGRKGKKTQPKNEEERVETRLVKAKPARRNMKTPRTSNAESTGEGGTLPPMMPPPRLSQISQLGTEEEKTRPTEPREEVTTGSEAKTDVILVVDSSETEDELEDRRMEQENEEAEESSSSIGSLASIGADRATATRLMKNPLTGEKRGKGRPAETGFYVGLKKAKLTAAESI